MSWQTAGHVGRVEWTQLFVMIEEEPTRIDSEKQFVVDELVKQTDLSELNRVSRLAWLCGKIGQRERSSSLFIHCSLLAPSQGVTFTGLIEKAREIFQGDELMELAERMFDVTVADDSSISTMLDLRVEFLDAENAARKSAELFDKLERDPTDISTRQARRGVRVFAQAGQLQKARQCLKAAMIASSQPTQNASSYNYSRVRAKTRLTRVDLIEMFPRDGTPFDDYSKWLAEAAQEVCPTVSDLEFDTALSVELLLVIAIRQAEQNALDAAALTLAPLFEKSQGEQVVREGVLEKEKTHELLAIDVLRLAEQFEPAYELQYALYQRNQLSSVRFGDLLRDTVRVKGADNAVALLEELLPKSLDEDLLEAALEIRPADSPLSLRIVELRRQSRAADSEHKKRSEAGRHRNAKRREWRAKAAEKR